MKHHYFYVALFAMSFFSVTGQSESFSFNADKLDKSAITFNGNQLKSEIENNSFLEKAMINFHPTLSFNGVDDYLIYSKAMKDLSQVTVFTIFRSRATDTINAQAVWGLHGASSDIALTTKGGFTGDKAVFYEHGNSNKPILHTYFQMHRSKGSSQEATYISIGATKKESLFPCFEGDIAEIVAYDHVLRGKKRQMIASALALKYGITLENNKDYLSSKKHIIWDMGKEMAYSNNIAGIGRDDVSGLYQKQATSSNNEGFLTIAADTLAISNQKNKSVLNDLDFIIWGSSSEPLTMESPEAVMDRIPLLKRKWMLKTSGTTASAISTQVQLDVSNLFDSIHPLEKYLMVIDKSGSGNFENTDLRYIASAAMSPNGILTFNDVQWDDDHSAKDAFSFTLLKTLKIEAISDLDAVCEGTTTSISYNATGGVPSYNYSLKSIENKVIVAWDSSQDIPQEYQVDGIGAGNYTLQITDALGTNTSKTITIAKEPVRTLDLGATQRLSFEGEITLSPTISDTTNIANYNWSLGTTYFSNQETVQITQPGFYTLTITTASGCSVTDTVEIKKSYIQEFTLFPNPSPDGKYTITVKLIQKASIHVSIYSLSGATLDGFTPLEEFTVENKFKINIKGKPIYYSGAYEVRLVTPFESVTKTLIIE